MSMFKQSKTKSVRGFFFYLVTSVMLIYLLWNGPFKTLFEKFGERLEFWVSGSPVYNIVMWFGSGERFGMTVVALCIIIFIMISPKAKLPGGKVK